MRPSDRQAVMLIDHDHIRRSVVDLHPLQHARNRRRYAGTRSISRRDAPATAPTSPAPALSRHPRAPVRTGHGPAIGRWASHESHRPEHICCGGYDPV
jgi:hypothetical protein